MGRITEWLGRYKRAHLDRFVFNFDLVYKIEYQMFIKKSM